MEKTYAQVSGSFLPQDVQLLLKDVSDIVEERDTQIREKAMQNGGHYSEDLPIEKLPSKEYMEIFEMLFEENYKKVALYCASLTRLVLAEFENPVFVSLVRAGVPCGVLMRRFAQKHLHRDVPHYGISIIRGRGLDENALLTILKNHPHATPIFVDGWTGKGMIQSQLAESLQEFYVQHGIRVEPHLAVLADPACCTKYYATREDFINPSCCLNSTICGLISRSVLNSRFIGPEDFHGVKIYWRFQEEDVTAKYLDTITEEFPKTLEASQKLFEKLCQEDRIPTGWGMKAAENIGQRYGISDKNRIKPSIGETTRVLLRRVPYKILVADRSRPELKHILFLAKEKKVPVEEYKEMPYLCCGLISNQKDGQE